MPPCYPATLPPRWRSCYSLQSCLIITWHLELVLASFEKGGRYAYTDGHILSHLLSATCNPTALLKKPKRSGMSARSCSPHSPHFLPNHDSGGWCIQGQLQGQGQNGNHCFTGCKLCLQHQSRSAPTWGGVPSTHPNSESRTPTPKETPGDVGIQGDLGQGGAITSDLRTRVGW